MKKILIITACSVLLAALPASASTDDANTTRFGTLRKSLTQSNMLQLQLFTGSGMQYGLDLPISFKTTDNDTKLSIEFKAAQFTNLKAVKDTLTLQITDDVTASEQVNKFLFHEFAPTVNLVPHQVMTHSSKLSLSTSETIHCKLTNISDSNNVTMTESSDFSHTNTFKIKFSCPTINIDNNDTVYDIDWVNKGDIYKFTLPHEKTGYRVVFTHGVNSFTQEDSGLPFTARPYLNMSMKDIIVPNIDSIGTNAPKITGPNAQLHFYIPENQFRNISSGPLNEYQTMVKSIQAMEESLKALGYNPNFQVVTNLNQADVSIVREALPDPHIHGEAHFNSHINKNVIGLDKNLSFANFYGRNLVFMHEIAHLIGLSHQSQYVDSYMGHTGVNSQAKLAPSENSYTNYFFTYADAQMLEHINQEILATESK